MFADEHYVIKFPVTVVNEDRNYLHVATHSGETNSMEETF